MAAVLETLQLSTEIGGAVDKIAAAQAELGRSQAFQTLFAASAKALEKLFFSHTDKLALELSATDSTDLEVLRHLELSIRQGEAAHPLSIQSDGVIQLIGFSLLTYLAKMDPGLVLLLDQPEDSLHPQAQRALVRVLQALPNQTFLATHSSNLLDRADPRKIRRLFRDEVGIVAVARPTALAEAEAVSFSRYTTPQTAEAFFARTTILVEGLSDKFAVEAAAEKLGKNLDGAGVTVVSLDGAGAFATFLGLLGPNGLKLRICGLCDSDKESDWRKALTQHGVGNFPQQQGLATAGFFVSTIDLEEELIRACGEANVIALIDSEGESGAFGSFCLQPDQSSKDRTAQIRGFLAKKGRKVRYVPLLVDLLAPSELPAPLRGVLEHAHPAT